MKRLSGVALATLLLASASQASATIATITYTGTTFGTFDGLGLFGTVGSSFDGDPFKLVYTLDTSKGVVGGSCSGGVCQVQISGGAAEGDSAPLTAALTIAGTTLTYSGTFDAGAVASQQDVCTSQCSVIAQSVLDNSGNSYVSTNAISSVSTSTFPLSLTQPFDVMLDGANVLGGGTFVVSGSGETVGNLHADEVILTTGVPEPATWAMMLIGFGGLGAALRSTRRRPLAA